MLKSNSTNVSCNVNFIYLSFFVSIWIWCSLGIVMKQICQRFLRIKWALEYLKLHFKKLNVLFSSFVLSLINADYCLLRSILSQLPTSFSPFKNWLEFGQMETRTFSNSLLQDFLFLTPSLFSGLFPNVWISPSQAPL